MMNDEMILILIVANFEWNDDVVRMYDDWLMFECGISWWISDYNIVVNWWMTDEKQFS